jgi:hypothetical protein
MPDELAIRAYGPMPCSYAFADEPTIAKAVIVVPKTESKRSTGPTVWLAVK